MREAGARLGVVTSKASVGTARSLAACGLAESLFDVIVTSDEPVPHKPDPAPVRLALERLDAPAESAAYVGDSVWDMRAGHAAGVTTMAALWGPFSERELAIERPHVMLDEIGGCAASRGFSAPAAPVRLRDPRRSVPLSPRPFLPKASAPPSSDPLASAAASASSSVSTRWKRIWSHTWSGRSSRSPSLTAGRMTSRMPARVAPSTFSFTPPIGRTRPESVISPVHGHVVPDRVVAERAHERHRHGDAGGRALLGDRAGRHVDVDLVVAETVLAQIGVRPRGCARR